jgi:hypothetical protein
MNGDVAELDEEVSNSLRCLRQTKSAARLKVQAQRFESSAARLKSY